MRPTSHVSVKYGFRCRMMSPDMSERNFSLIFLAAGLCSSMGSTSVGFFRFDGGRMSILGELQIKKSFIRNRFVCCDLFDLLFDIFSESLLDDRLHGWRRRCGRCWGGLDGLNGVFHDEVLRIWYEFVTNTGQFIDNLLGE